MRPFLLGCMVNIHTIPRHGRNSFIRMDPVAEAISNSHAACTPVLLAAAHACRMLWLRNGELLPPRARRVELKRLARHDSKGPETAQTPPKHCCRSVPRGKRFTKFGGQSGPMVATLFSLV